VIRAASSAVQFKASASLLKPDVNEHAFVLELFSFDVINLRQVNFRSRKKTTNVAVIYRAELVRSIEVGMDRKNKVTKISSKFEYCEKSVVLFNMIRCLLVTFLGALCCCIRVVLIRYTPMFD